jgi:hypothetical protein
MTFNAGNVTYLIENRLGDTEIPVESQPTESQPAESEPAESQPAESQPSTESGSGSSTGGWSWWVLVRRVTRAIIIMR